MKLTSSVCDVCACAYWWYSGNKKKYKSKNRRARIQNVILPVLELLFSLSSKSDLTCRIHFKNQSKTLFGGLMSSTLAHAEHFPHFDSNMEFGRITSSLKPWKQLKFSRTTHSIVTIRTLFISYISMVDFHSLIQNLLFVRRSIFFPMTITHTHALRKWTLTIWKYKEIIATT